MRFLPKTLRSAALPALLLLAGAARGQAGRPVADSLAPPAAPRARVPRNVLKINPLGLIHGQMPFTTETRLGYERVLGRHTSLMGSASYLGSNYVFSFVGSFALSAAISSAITLSGHPTVVWSETTLRSHGSRYQVQLRRYLGAGPAPEGFYLAPHYSFTKVDYTVRFDDFDYQVGLTTTNRNYNLLVGYQNVLGRHFTVDVFTGLGYLDKVTTIYTPDGRPATRLPYVSGLKVSSGLNLGWAF